MSLFPTLVLALTASSIAASPVMAARHRGVSPVLAAPQAVATGVRIALLERPRDQDRAFRAAREGRSMPLPMIERRVMPHMGDADYLGPELRGESYRLKFMQDGRVIWVDVDAATGRIMRKSDR